MVSIFRCIIPAFLVFAPALVGAQTEEESVAEPVSDEDLLTQAELENLVAPIALFPDTLLIQILVAATSPMEVVKSDRLLASMDGEEPEVIQAAVEAEEWDESVEVLAVAFPEVIEDMATHIEWTETMGDAMLAQSDEVMAAIQTMRTQAINNGALVSGEEQVVEVTQDETVIIQPADPEVVYVPQYDPQVVYTDNNSNLVGDAIVTGAVAFGTFALIDAIFDDDDDWNDYWGCRNCGGWGGGPIYRNPNIDLDVDGNVNIGNDINIGNGDIDRPNKGWAPDDRKKDQARDKIASRKDEGGKTKLPINKGENSSDALRSKLSQKSGAPDISRPGSQAKTEAVRKTMKDGGKPKVNRPTPSKAVKKPAKKPAVRKPSAAKSHVKKTSKPKAVKKPKATRKKSSGQKARKASQRGKASGKKAKRRG